MYFLIAQKIMQVRNYLTFLPPYLHLLSPTPLIPEIFQNDGRTVFSLPLFYITLYLFNPIFSLPQHRKPGM